MSVSTSPVTSEATCVRAADSFVSWPRGWSNRHPLKHAHADVRHPLSDRLLIHVDPVAVPRSERPSVACGLTET